MSDFSPSTYVLLYKKIKSALSGISSIEETSTGFKIKTKDGGSFSFTIPNWHVHNNKSTLDLLVQDSDGNLTFDSKKIPTKDDLENLQALLEQLINSKIPSSQIDDSLNTSKTKTYSIDKILSLLKEKQKKIYFSQPDSSVILEDNDILIEKENGKIILKVYDLSTNKWNELVGGTDEDILEWKSNESYKIKDRVKYGDNIYECISDHISSNNFDDNNWIVLLNHYYNLSLDKYNSMVEKGLITDDNKYLYVVNENNKDYYEEKISEKSNTWSIQHNLNTEWYKLDITILDDVNSINYGDIDLEQTTNNLLVLKFTEPISGMIYIKNN